MMEEKNSIEWGATKIMLNGQEIKGISSIEYKEPVRGFFDPANSPDISVVTRALYRRNGHDRPGCIIIDDYMSDDDHFYGAKNMARIAKMANEITGTIKMSKRDMRRLSKLFPKPKKVRLPRKQKKALKKAWRKLDTDTFVKLLPKEANYITCSPLKTKDLSSIYSIKL